MDRFIFILWCALLGTTVGHYVQGEAPYNIGPNDPYAVTINSNLLQQPSQRLFWDKFGNNGQGANQVGGSGGLWTTLTNKFPFLGNMFGRMELPTQYGVPNQYDIPTQFGLSPQKYQTANNQFDISTLYGAPQQRYQAQFQSYQTPQFYQAPQFFPQRFPQQLGRDVALTDDAVIITPPQVPIQPLPVPAPAPTPGPSAEGYQYSKPQFRLELPHK